MRILHVLSQRPDSTGSGVTLDALVSHAAAAGWDQSVVCGIAADAEHPAVGGLAEQRVFPLRFGTRELPFLLPGMSDVMPYPSTRFSAMSGAQVSRYQDAWRRHLGRVVAGFQPDLIHSHHVWLLSALLRDVAPGVPVVTHCHATGLRQMELCPHLRETVCAGCARNHRFVALTARHARDLVERLGVERARVAVVGAGYRDDLFHARGRSFEPAAMLVYVGKLARAKGVPYLLDATERLAERHRFTLHLAGAGGGDEGAALAARARRLPFVRTHGQLAQPALADLLRACDVLALPSFYEGLPLVVVEALACGCRPVCTRLPGVEEEIAPRLGDALTLVELPRLRHADQPVPEDLPAFVDRLARALEHALAAGPVHDADPSPFTWGAVFTRVERVWREIVA